MVSSTIAPSLLLSLMSSLSWATQFSFVAAQLPIPAQNTSNWGPYDPFFPVEPYAAPPDGCTVTQVNLIQRHGARWPTSGARSRQVAAVAKLQAVRPFTDPKLEFLNTFVYDFGVADLLPFGANQSHQIGSDMYARYSAFFDAGDVPFVRAAGDQRVVDSSTNWTAGFGDASGETVLPTLQVVLQEDGNCTLCNNMCPNEVDGDESTTWLGMFGPNITARLNAAAPGANLSDSDTLTLMDMCPFDTLSSGNASPFCDLFTAEEYVSYEYYYDLDKYYGTGPGNALGPVQGVGYVNELLARLTGQAVQDETQTNRTLDSNPTTFPLNRTFYADFSHDNTMVPIFAALGLFNSTALDPLKPDENRLWVDSKLVPFSGHMTVEKLACSGKEAVRVLVNDAVQPLEFCGGVDGVCELAAFVESQTYARENGQGDFSKCGFVPS
ncbi:phytase [Peniophora sp. CONT]|nr:phytase [Peniophora sp. CONT]